MFGWFRREPSARMAEKLVARGKIDAAIRQYRRLLEDNPEDTGTLNRVGDLYSRVSKFSEATELYRQTAERFVDEGFYVKAIAVYKKIHRLDAKQYDVHEKLAELYTLQGLVSDARTQYEELAKYHESQGDLDSSIAVCRKVVELEPQDPSHRTRLAELYQKSGNLEAVLKEYLQIAWVMLEHGRLEQAVQVLERALAVEPGDIDFIADTVRMLRRRGHTEIAEELVSEAEKLNRERDRGDLVSEIRARYEELKKEVSVPAEPVGDDFPEVGVPSIPDEEAAVGGEEEILDFDETDLTPDEVGVPLGRLVEEDPEASVSRGTTDAERAAAQPGPQDLLAEVEVFIKYGFREKALDRLGEVLRILPDNTSAYKKLVFLLLEDESHRAAQEAGNKMAEAAATSGDREDWEEVKTRLLEAGFLVQGDEVKAPPAIASAGDEEFELLEEDGADLHSVIEAAGKASSAREEIFVLDPDEIAASEELGVEIDPVVEVGKVASEEATDSEVAEEQVEFVVVDDEFADLAAEVEREIEEAAAAPVGEGGDAPSLEEIVESFKQGVAENLSAEDFDTHYNLGIAYREMGLIDEAVNEFEIAAESPEYFIGCCSLLGLCMREKGDAEGEMGWYRKGLDKSDLVESERLALLYELGEAYESSGNLDAALETFTDVSGADSSYRDVEARVAALQS